MNAYGLIQSVIKSLIFAVLALSAFIITKRAGIPTLFVFSLEKVNRISATQQFIKRIDDDSEERSILRTEIKSCQRCLRSGQVIVFQTLKNTPSLSHGVSYTCFLMQVYFYNIYKKNL